MNFNNLNDISKLYLEQVIESAVPGKPAEKLGAVTPIPKAEQDAARERTLAKAKAMREKKGIKEAAKPDYLDFDKDGNKKESMRKALRDKVNQKVEESKKSNDGNLANNYPPYDKVTRGDIVAGALGQDQMGGKKKTKVKVKESFSNWREDLFEIADKIKTNKSEESKVVEKTVNNTIKINPNLDLGETVENLGGTLLEMFEIDEEIILETIDIATEYFYEQGLNEDGIDILIEELGTDEFINFVFEIVEDYTLNEARTLLGKKKTPATGKARGISLKAAPGKSTKSAVEKHGTKRSLSSQSASGTIRKKSIAVKKSVEKQPETKSTPSETKKGIAGKVGAALGYAVKRAKQDTAKVARAAGTVAGAVHGAGIVAHRLGQEAGKSKTGQKIKKAVGLTKEETELQEKSPPGFKKTVEAMKKHDEIDNPFALAWWMKKKGYKSHKESVEESVADSSPLTPQELQAQRQRANIDNKIAKLRQQALMKQKKPEPVVGEEVEIIDEIRRSEKEGKGSPEKREGKYLIGARQQRRERGERGGRHFWSGGQGGSRIERGKKKGEEGSQHQRLNPPEKKGRQLQRGTKSATDRAYGYGQGRYQGD